ncbi:MAG: hypothetical protein QM761_09340 [Pseudoxanthomonas sp.]
MIRSHPRSRWLSTAERQPARESLLPLPLILTWLLTSSPFRSGGAGGNNPQGGAQGCAPFFAAAGCRVEKSRRRSEPSARSAEGAKAGCAFFWLLFFAQAKKSNPRASAERFIAVVRLASLAGMTSKSNDRSEASRQA